MCAACMQAEGVAVSWSQTTDEVRIKVPVAAGVRGKDVSFEVHPTRLKLDVAGQCLLQGQLTEEGNIRSDDSYWVLESEDDGKYVAITLTKATMGHESWPALLEEDLPDTTVTHRVYLDVQVGQRVARLVLGLFGNVVPKTVENFRALVSGEKGIGPVSGKPLHFKGSVFHRIIPGFMAQGGDITLGNGMGGESIYGEMFKDENFKVKHDSRGLLAMANAGPNTNNSQFYITFTPTSHLDGKHVVFGKVEAGWSTLMLMEGAGSDSGAPTSPVTILDCQEVGLDADPEALVEAAAAEQREQKYEAEVVAAAEEGSSEADEANVEGQAQ
eukprot:GHRR01011771.1.p1 GENE.GHRR01011771.1~~GHRR01011771.1.p1  ORF type:complete len:328 (+),score=115.83 GHRR01011771.1:407-1390(+)